ncbi:MAG TPA: DMT family transporter [Ramlibacter sp.]|uniref:DMT family transporter n=1 Tax=Ramlibacter sp. TaxID=1917967 RepID=UPI002CB7952A|nr:DMT family transporter [Ramlibacter sp.]HVZ46222.1 DMT family transporter [Ramlibacter sp.]
MVLAALLFSAMGACIKFAAGSFSAAEIIFYRGLISMVFMWAFARATGVTLATRYPRMHAWRSFVGVISLAAWFYAIAGLPLATAISLNYMSSVWIALFMIAGSVMAWQPKDDAGTMPLNGSLIMTVLAGFAGVVLLLRPSIRHDQLVPGMAGVLSGITAALAYMQVVALSRLREPETRTVFYFAVGGLAAGLAVVPFTGFSPWSWAAATWLLPIGVLASLGQLCMTRAYSRAGTEGGTLLVANLQYSGILFSAFFGWLLFDDRISLLGWTGVALIVASGIAATVIRSRAVPDAPGEEH